MAATVQHVFTSPIADGTNTQLVRPSNWNSGHLVTMNAVGSEISGAFSNANNVTFALETNGFVTASASYPSQSVQPVAISGSNGSFAFSTVTMGNLNGLSFYTSNGSVVGSHNGLTTAAQSDHSHGNPTLALTNLSGTTASNSGGFTLSLSAALGGGAGDGYNILAAGTQTAGTAATINFANSNGITFGMSNSSQITASHNGLTQQSTQPVAYSAANGSANFSTLSFANSNGVSFSTGTQGVFATVATNYQSQGAYLTTARASNDAIGLNTALTANGLSVTANSSGLSINVPAWLTTAAQSNHSHGNPTLALTNINGTTASASNGLTLSLSAIVPAQTVQPVAASGSNGSFAFSTLSFGASNGLTFYTTNGSIVASYTDAGAGGGVNFSAGAQSSALAAVTFADSNGVSFGLNGVGVITASVNAAGGGATVAGWEPFQAGNNTTFSSLGQNSLYIQKLFPEQNYNGSYIELRVSGSFVSSSNSQVAAHTIRYGLYSLNTANNSYNSIATSSLFINASYNSSTAMGYTISQGAGSYTITSNNTVLASLMTGLKHLYLPLTTTLTAGGQYAFGVLISSATTVGTSPHRMALLNQTIINNLTIGKVYASTLLASNATNVGDFNQGVYATTTGSMPAAFAKSDMTNAVSQARLYMQLEV